MFQISLLFLLGIYAFFVLVYLVFAAINLYHLLAFGFFSFESVFMIFFLIAGTIIILGVTTFFAIQIDWTINFTL